MVLAMITWGLSWTNAKILGTYVDPPLVMFWRFLLASLSFVFVLIITKNYGFLMAKTVIKKF